MKQGNLKELGVFFSKNLEKIGTIAEDLNEDEESGVKKNQFFVNSCGKKVFKNGENSEQGSQKPGQKSGLISDFFSNKGQNAVGDFGGFGKNLEKIREENKENDAGNNVNIFGKFIEVGLEIGKKSLLQIDNEKKGKGVEKLKEIDLKDKDRNLDIINKKARKFRDNSEKSSVGKITNTEVASGNKMQEEEC